jgi:hypothetical protein
MDSITLRQTYIARMFPENGERGLIQLEEAYIVEIMKLMVYVERKADPLI